MPFLPWTSCASELTVFPQVPRTLYTSQWATVLQLFSDGVPSLLLIHALCL